MIYTFRCHPPGFFLLAPYTESLPAQLGLAALAALGLGSLTGEKKFNTPGELGAAIKSQPRLNLVATVGDVDVYALAAGK